ncbi:hypothetical protein P43SY_009630 [Pythium insidiosum]|uniref:Transmembrane protein n=1 Tax=Pythium insidiosum TaxID=114742 RepID=A0AAD5LFR0_PYTIN|nr:hypothetical protein P43SY_009630 [Pythium insidiosum]KAJ0399838.1 hypothetical protein ATCC90586_005380 [Pythium insidiosum]
MTLAADRPVSRHACAQWATRLLFPKVIEFKVISREHEKHEFMPVVYLIDRSASWKQRVPRMIEQQLVEEYIAPLLARSSHTSLTPEDLDNFSRALHERTELLNAPPTAVCIDESLYKLGLLIDFAPKPSLPKSDLFRVVRQLLTTLAAATHRRALIVPVSVHFCADRGVFSARRYAGIRYGAPVLLEDRDVEIFREDPFEFVQHVTAKLSASLKMQPPQTAEQMDILRLSRSLHVYCAKVYRDDCFSRRQIASMNEEILQIHFRTRNHPDMLALKAKMHAYCARLKKWKLVDEDINAATVAATTPRNFLQVACIVASLMLRLASLPWRLVIASVCDLIYRPQSRKVVEIAAVVSAFLKSCTAFVLLGVLTRLGLAGSWQWLLLPMALTVLILHLASSLFGGEEVAAHWKKIQFYVMDAAELQQLKETRAVLARHIHAIVARYVSTDLPPPVLQDSLKRSHSPVTTDGNEYSLNPHHKIFINAPRSFPLQFAAGVADNAVVRRAVYAPKMLRDEAWRNIYGALAPPHLQFSVLLADNKGDSLPMERLLATPFFDAVLTAYVNFKRSRAGSDSESESDKPSECVVPNAVERVIEDGSLGSFRSVEELINACIELAEEEEELSS